MISIGKLGATSASYYMDEVAPGPEAYYAGSGEAPGAWVGSACASLGLEGEVSGEALAAVLAGRRPGVGDSLVTGKAASPGRLAGFDLTFSAPKGVSLMAALGPPEVATAARAAHDAAVAEALSYLEDHAAWARRGHDGLVLLRAEGLVAGAFRHRASRAGDPQLHTHVVVANLAHGEDERWSALWGRPIYAQARTAGFVYQAALRAGLSESLGIRWGPVHAGMAEPAGFTTAQLRAFSRRRAQVEASLAAHGASGPAAAQVATLATRASKVRLDDAGRAEQRAEWVARAASLGLDGEGIAAMVGPGRSTRLAPEALDALVDRLLGPEGLTAHAGVFERRDVIRAVAEAAESGAHLAQLEARADVVLADRRVVHLAPAPAGEARATTTEMLALEEEVIAQATSASGAGLGVVDADVLASVLESRPSLSGEQREMVRCLVTSGAGVEVVVGRAGAGKTFALDAARAAWQQGGHPVLGAALAARAAAELEAGAGISSTTLARLLADLGRPEALVSPGAVIVVDEAALVGTRDLHRLLQVARRHGAQVVLVGDDHQMPEVAAGGGFGALARALPAIELSENRRQREAWEREALAELRCGRVALALERYEGNGRTCICESAEAARAALVSDWLSARDEGEAVMIALRRGDVEALNTLARAALVASGEVHGPELVVGDVAFGIGDVVMAHRNDARAGLVNGTRGTVTGIDTGARTLEVTTAAGEARTVPVSYLEAGHLGLGHAMTLHKAQGMTVERAFLLGDESLYREAGYVGLSRARQRSDLYVLAPSGADPEACHSGRVPERSPMESLLAHLSTSRAKQLATEVPTATLAELATERQELLARVLEGLPADPAARLAALEGDRERVSEALSSPEVAMRAWATRESERLETERGRLVAQGEARQAHGLRHRATLGRLSAIAEEEKARAALLGQGALASPPGFLVEALGPPPAAREARGIWREAAVAVLSYRERHGVTDPELALGPEVGDLSRRLERRSAERVLRDAARALGREIDGPRLDLGMGL